MIRLTHTLPVIRELEARTEVNVVEQDGERTMVETSDGERFWIATVYLKEFK